MTHMMAHMTDANKKYLEALEASGEEIYYEYDVPLGDPAAEAARQAALASGGPHVYEISDGLTGESEVIEAPSMEEAVSWARRWLLDVEWDTRAGTAWADARVLDLLTGRRETTTVQIDPPVPACADGGREHDWAAPHRLVGGCKENPGVWAHGGGVVMHDVCLRCGCLRVTDTWARRPDTGQEGLRSVRYVPGRYARGLERL